MIGVPSFNLPNVFTFLPIFSNFGALIKTHLKVDPCNPSIETFSSKLLTCLPNALRVTSVSINPRGSGLLSVNVPAIVIIPAQVPQTGIP